LISLGEIEGLMDKPKGNIVCPNCKHIVTLKNLIMSDCKVLKLNYKLHCSNCEKEFKTKWRDISSKEITETTEGIKLEKQGN